MQRQLLPTAVPETSTRPAIHEAPHQRRPLSYLPEPGGGGLAELHEAYARTREPGLRAQLAEAYDGFARTLARGFPTRRESKEDLIQVARIGLVQAIDRFDPERGHPFTAFAQATIRGELKRHVRDHTWALRVPRSLQEHFLEVIRAADDLTLETGCFPRIQEIADRTALDDGEVAKALEVGRSSYLLSLDRSEPDERPARDLVAHDAGLDAVERRDLVSRLVRYLSDQDREIVRLRFVEEKTQSDIAARFGVSQMYISRRLARILRRMRATLSEAVPDGIRT